MVICTVETSKTTGTERGVGREERLTSRCTAVSLPKLWQRAHHIKMFQNAKVTVDQINK
jgi:hypothetical protein